MRLHCDKRLNRERGKDWILNRVQVGATKGRARLSQCQASCWRRPWQCASGRLSVKHGAGYSRECQ